MSALVILLRVHSESLYCSIIIYLQRKLANQFKVECLIVFMFSFMVCWCKKQHVQLHLLRVCLCCIHAKERRNLRNTLHFNTDRVI